MSNHGNPLSGDGKESDSDGTEPLPDAGDEQVSHESTFVLGSGVDAVAEQDPVEQLQAGTVLRERYLLQERIGAGSMGVVFKALDRHLADPGGIDTPVAIKVLGPGLSESPEALRALQQEAAKGRCLIHPGIVRFIDLDREDDFYFIVMEWLDGQSLAEVLDAGRLADDLPRILDLVRQIADALEYAHQRGVVHADIKPGNIVLLPDGTAKLIDFGIARLRQQDSGADRAPAVIRAATRTYASMQVLTGETPVIADDVFSLACLAYRMIAGHRVFGPRNAAEAAELGMEPQRPALLNDSQWQALKKGLSHARVMRQQSAAELVAGLMPAHADEAGGSAPVRIPGEAPTGRHSEPPERRLGLIAMLFVTLVAIAALVTNPGLLEQGASQVRELAGGTRVPQPGNTAGISAVQLDSASVPQAATPPPAATSVSAEDAAAPAAATERPAADQVMQPDAALPASAGNSDSRTVATSPADSANPAEFELAHAGRPSQRIVVTVIENGAPASITLRRTAGLAEPLLLRIDEVGFSGRRSPGGSGEYTLTGDGVISMDAGQAEAELVIGARDDGAREVDRTISLTLRDYYDAEAVLGQIELRLLDDDQRTFEANLPVNTVAFVRRDLSVQERDPAVQIDIVRFNPDNNPLVVRYVARDLTATEGEDYFAPTQSTITFGPGQRNARLLISLVQDTVPEGDEYFAVELDPAMTHATTSGRVSVTIRDDDAFAE